MLDFHRPAPPKTLNEARTQIDGLWKFLTDVQSVVSELKSQNEELREQVNELNERIGKSSRNSSRPPSSDSTSQRAKRRRKPKSDKIKGAQPGHEKHERALIPESDVDQIQRYFPAALCGCGGSVAIESDPRCRHQVFDIPVVSFSVIEHQLYGGQCSGCGKHHCAQTPDSVPAGQMGPNLVALIAHLSGRYHLSIRNIQDLIRKFTDIAGRVGNGGKVGRRLLLLAHSVIRTRHRWQNQHIDETIYYRRMHRLRQSFHHTLERGARLRIDGRTKRQCQHLLRREAMCWTFLKDHQIPLDNNTAEQALRPYVIWRKLSFASQSYQGDQFRPLILSIVGTAQRLGISSYQFLRTACHESMILGEVKIRFSFDTPRLPAG